MELRQLEHFDEIVRASSFGRAADKLNITQPALSKSIRNLERSLGCILLERHPAGVTATDYGRVFLDYATLVTSELDRAVRTDSSLFMASLLKGSQFLSYLPAAPIALDAAYAHLVPIPTEPAIWAPVPVGVTYRRRGVMLQSTRRFINRLKDVGAELSRG